MKTEAISNIFSNHNGMTLEINYKKKTGLKKNYIETEKHATRQLMVKGGTKRKLN